MSAIESRYRLPTKAALLFWGLAVLGGVLVGGWIVPGARTYLGPSFGDQQLPGWARAGRPPAGRSALRYRRALEHSLAACTRGDDRCPALGRGRIIRRLAFPAFVVCLVWIGLSQRLRVAAATFLAEPPILSRACRWSTLPCGWRSPRRSCVTPAGRTTTTTWSPQGITSGCRPPSWWSSESPAGWPATTGSCPWNRNGPARSLGSITLPGCS